MHLSSDFLLELIILVKLNERLANVSVLGSCAHIEENDKGEPPDIRISQSRASHTRTRQQIPTSLVDSHGPNQGLSNGLFLL